MADATCVVHQNVCKRLELEFYDDPFHPLHDDISQFSFIPETSSFCVLYTLRIYLFGIHVLYWSCAVKPMADIC